MAYTDIQLKQEVQQTMQIDCLLYSFFVEKKVNKTDINRK